jgi:hypothetical protein
MTYQHNYVTRDDVVNMVLSQQWGPQELKRLFSHLDDTSIGGIEEYNRDEFLAMFPRLWPKVSKDYKSKYPYYFI